MEGIEINQCVFDDLAGLVEYVGGLAPNQGNFAHAVILYMSGEGLKPDHQDYNVPYTAANRVVTRLYSFANATAEPFDEPEPSTPVIETTPVVNPDAVKPDNANKTDPETLYIPGPDGLFDHLKPNPVERSIMFEEALFIMSIVALIVSPYDLALVFLILRGLFVLCRHYNTRPGRAWSRYVTHYF